MEQDGRSDGLFWEGSKKAMEALNLQNHETIRQSGWVSEVLHRWRYNFDDSTPKWVEVGVDDGVFAWQKWVFNWGEVEKIGKIWILGVVEQEQALYDAIVFEKDRIETQNSKRAFGFEQLARITQALIVWDLPQDKI